MNASTSEIRTQPHPNCILCGLPGRPLYADLPSALFETAGRWHFSQCPRSECGLIWINPCPIENDLHLAYERYFTHEEASDGDTGGLRNILYSIYLAANCPIWWATGVAREKARRKQMFLEETPPGKLLDVGCGDGTFLHLMRSKGWDVDGIDFDPKAVETAKRKFGLALRHGDLRAASLPADTFDAVTMSHVIEHLPQPVEMLAEIKRILKPGGRLIMTTPNTAGIGHIKFGSAWFGIDAPRHLHLFNKRSLSEAARRASLEVHWAGSTSASADVFIGASYTIMENKQHRMGHQPTPSVLRTFKAAGWQLREHFTLKRDPDCGEELVLICQKPSS